MKHVQLPNNMTVTKELDPKDLLIYVTIKSFSNSKTLQCNPSLETIVKKSGVSKPTVRKSIKKLEELNYIEVKKLGRGNDYRFNPHKNFEPFSYEFLEKEDLTPNEKAYIIATQQYMYKDIEGKGKMTYSYSEIADKINLSYNSVVKYNKSLEDKGFLNVISTGKKDPVSGVYIQEKFYHLDELGQAIVFTLKNHEERLEKTESDVEILKRQVNILLAENKKLKEVFNEVKL